MSRYPSDTMNQTVKEAIDICNSQEALAKAMGCSQSRVSRLLLEQQKVEAEDAIAIEAATGGQIPRWRLRPDLWSQPLEQAA